MDDVLDLTASEEVLGKPVASDLREGKATLAVIHSLEHGTAEDRDAILQVLDDRSFERVQHKQILDILVRNGSVDYAMQAAFRYAEMARKSLGALPYFRVQARTAVGAGLRRCQRKVTGYDRGFKTGICAAGRLVGRDTLSWLRMEWPSRLD